MTKPSICCVVPSIRPEQMESFRKAWAPLFERHGVTLITVWDGDDPIIETVPNAYGGTTGFPARELIGNDPWGNLICRKTDAVRNVGFIEAARQGYEYIFTADDDVAPPAGSDPIQEHLDVLQRCVPVSWMNTAVEGFKPPRYGYQDVGPAYEIDAGIDTRNKPLYLRGFPYGTRDEAPVKVSHGVWVNVPDFDGRTQLELGKCSCKSLPPGTMGFIECQKCNGTGYDGSRLPYSLPYFRGPIPKGVYMPFCFLPETEVTLVDGSRKEIQSVKTNDMVYAKDGMPHPVIRTIERHYDGEVVTLRVAGRDRTITCTPNHSFMVLRGSSPEWVEASDIKPKDMIAAPVVRDRCFPSSPGLSMAKVIGYFLAEGSYDKYSPNANHGKAGQPHGITFTFGTVKKGDAINDCTNALDALGIKWNKHSPRESVTVVTTNVSYELLETLKKHRVGEYSHGKRLPAGVYSWTLEDKRALLKAYWVDGCFNTTVRGNGTVQVQCQVKTRSRTMALQVQLLLQSVGLTASVARLSPYKQSKECWSVSMNGRQAKSFQAFIEGKGLPEVGRFGHDKAFCDGEYHYYAVKEVSRSSYSGPVYNLTVQDDHSYIAEGLVVKNCGMNLMVHKDALPYLYFAPMGQDSGVEGLNRFADIWMGLLLRRAMDDRKWAIYTGASTVLHTRASDPFKNVEQEKLGIEWNEKIWKLNAGTPAYMVDEPVLNYVRSWYDKADRFRKMIRELQGEKS